MIKITKILNHGGICPFQIDALTNDNRLIYGRYRGGRLSVYIGEAGNLAEDSALFGERVFFKDFGKPLDGCMDLAEFKEETKETLDFSEAVDESRIC
ncbi:MAG: hypothetical protein FMNOHCHN_02058 [Ignavibacteriaceae bacterium]|nr:hypothetical protein [Ignavibacteriaceae bacterium]